jgi:hypothetical protein
MLDYIQMTLYSCYIIRPAFFQFMSKSLVYVMHRSVSILTGTIGLYTYDKTSVYINHKPGNVQWQCLGAGVEVRVSQGISDGS